MANRVPWAQIQTELPVIDGPTIKVRATRMGEYEYARRREGDVFTLKPRMITVVHTEKGHPKLGEPVMENGAVKMRLLTAEEQFSARWMERVDAEVPEKITAAQEALDRQQAELNEGRRPSRRSAGA